MSVSIYQKRLSRILPPCRTCNHLSFEADGMPVCHPVEGSDLVMDRSKSINDNQCSRWQKKSLERLTAEKLAGFEDVDDVESGHRQR